MKHATKDRTPPPLAPPRPSIEALAASLGMTAKQVREMGRRYRAYCLGVKP